MVQDQPPRWTGAHILATISPDSLVRSHAAELEAALAKDPMRWRELLIGKLGNRRGLKVSQGSKSYLEGISSEVLAVLGKLGDTEAERKLIEEYHAEKDGTQKEGLAQLLGYMATSKASPWAYPLPVRARPSCTRKTRL